MVIGTTRKMVCDLTVVKIRFSNGSKLVHDAIDDFIIKVAVDASSRVFLLMPLQAV